MTPVDSSFLASNSSISYSFANFTMLKLFQIICIFVVNVNVAINVYISYVQKYTERFSPCVFLVNIMCVFIVDIIHSQTSKDVKLFYIRSLF